MWHLHLLIRPRFSWRGSRVCWHSPNFMAAIGWVTAAAVKFNQPLGCDLSPTLTQSRACPLSVTLSFCPTSLWPPSPLHTEQLSEQLEFHSHQRTMPCELHACLKCQAARGTVLSWPNKQIHYDHLHNSTLLGQWENVTASYCIRHGRHSRLCDFMTCRVVNI